MNKPQGKKFNREENENGQVTSVSKKILHNHALELKSKKQEALVYAENMNKQKLFIDGNSSLGEINLN